MDRRQTAPAGAAAADTGRTGQSPLSAPEARRQRRRTLRTLAALLGTPLAGQATGAASTSQPDSAASTLGRRPLAFPRDHGAHAEARTEWWYWTGHLRPVAGPAAAAGAGPSHGFQVTFFRSRVDAAAAIASRFAARQLIFAHAAVSDLRAGRLWHDDRAARAGFGVAEAAADDTRVHLRDWRLERDDRHGYSATLASEEFALDLVGRPSQPLLLQGQDGWSRKGPAPTQASFYYSQPQLDVNGRLRLRDRWLTVAGTGWLDHEWSEALLAPEAVGWDWTGINLFDGAALTAFRLRRADGSALWDGGSLRPAGGVTRAFAPGQTRFEPLRWWTSPATGARYPVEWSLLAAGRRWHLRALLDAQELDSRRSTGTVYWEGLSELRDESGARRGLGYLELTGYAGRLRI